MRLMRDETELNTRDEGFTLVELIVAMLILGIVMASMITVQVRTLETNADTAARSEATALGNAAMEEFRSVPWNVLRKGLAHGFVAAAGGDSLVSGSTLTVGGVSMPLVIAPSGASDQDLSSPWSPLFDGSGSNAQQFTDPSGNGTVFTVKAYVTRNVAYGDGAVGLAVVVEWTRDGAPVSRTLMQSIAYAPVGGCGDLDIAPFLTSCQPTYRSNASSANVGAYVNRYPYDTTTGTVGDAMEIIDGTLKLSLGSTSTRATAAVDSAQYSSTSATIEYPLSSVTPTSSTATTLLVGGSSRVSQASDNTADPDAPPAHGGVNSGTGTTSLTSVSLLSSVSGRGDDSRAASATASTTTACQMPGGSYTPSGQPCASGLVNANGSASMATTWTFPVSSGNASLNLSLMDPNAPGASGAWAARFAQGGSAGSAGTTGCSALSGAGCVSAGASSRLPYIYSGRFATGQWDGAQAPYGLIVLTNYSDSVRAERGAAQLGSPSYARSGTLYVWNGSAYQTVSLGTAAQTAVSSASVTYTDALVTIEASAVATATSADTRITGSDCAVDRCRAQVDAGLVSITLTLRVTPATGAPYVLEGVTLVNGANGLAQFTEPDVA